MYIHQGKPAAIYIPAERLYTKDPKMMNQFQYCERKQVPYLVIVGCPGGERQCWRREDKERSVQSRSICQI